MKENNLDINELTDKYISENNFEEEMKTKVEPYLDSLRKSGYLFGSNNLKLYYERFVLENPKGNIVICHGFGEFIERYNELIYYFLRENYSVYIMEHRGHGRSNRLGSDKSQINVEKFDYYIEDFKIFIEEVVIPNSKKKELLLFAHSMGGGIGTVFLEKYTEYFKAAVLSAPMHKINTGKYPTIVAEVVSRILKLIKSGNTYLPGQKPYNGTYKVPNRVTTCEGRYDYSYNKMVENEVFQTGGSSANWYIEASKATRRLRKEKNASKVKIPVMLLQPENDTHVMPQAQNTFAKYAENCELVKINDARHESFNEKDKIAFPVFERILKFYSNII
ncbi:MAG: alpha/beta hydrolase [Clostridium butyricum]|nr:alpha/beta hydrolase [Clostridium butyricum]